MNMKRINTIICLAALAAFSHAGVNFNLSNATQSVAAPGSGFVLVTFSGTITTSGGFAPTDFVVELPNNGTDTLVFDSFNTNLVNYVVAGVANTSYTGDLFSLRVASTDSMGVYDQGDTPSGFSIFSEAIAHAAKNGVDAADNEFYSVEVVPEPTSLALLGMGGAALLVRRRRR